MDRPAKFARHRRELVEVIAPLDPCVQHRKGARSDLRGHPPDVRQFAGRQAAEKLPDCCFWTSPHRDVRFGYEAERAQVLVNCRLRPSPRVKWCPHASVFEEPAGFVAYLYPTLVSIAIAPLMQKATAGRKHPVDFLQNLLPIGSEVEETGNDHHVKCLRAEWKGCALTADST